MMRTGGGWASIVRILHAGGVRAQEVALIGLLRDVAEGRLRVGVVGVVQVPRRVILGGVEGIKAEILRLHLRAIRHDEADLAQDRADLLPSPA